ncbi:uncharacterized protein FFMR_11815 [Fusarium fujikuroi]|nr:uncharacterized protein FFMR_11815 [Fusarium fujikuroi]
MVNKRAPQISLLK